MVRTKAALRPVCADGLEGRCAREFGSRKTPASRTGAICGDRHMSVDVPSLIAWRLLRSLESKKNEFSRSWNKVLSMTYQQDSRHRLEVDQQEC